MIPTLPVTPVQLMRPGIGQNVSCELGDCLTSRPEGRSRPRELWFSCGTCMSLHVYLVGVRESLVVMGTIFDSSFNKEAARVAPERVLA